MASAVPLPVDDALQRAPAFMAAEIRTSLLSAPPSLPSKYFYDDTGSALFERITGLPEYYQTRTEERLLARIIGEVIERTRPSELVELGSGAGHKIRLVLDAQRRAGRPLALALFDINHAFLHASARRLAASYPRLDVRTVAGDFTRDLAMLGHGPPRLVLLFAGTIGNLHPDDVPAFLARVARQLRPGDHFLVGVDTVKDIRVLEAAYNDSQGVTAAFNLNILTHINRELDADFDLTRFEHVAFWDQANSWIEMRLRATAASRVRIAASWLDLRFRAGDEVRTEISCKYTRASFAARLAGTGLFLEQWYCDPREMFALALLGVR